MSRLYCDILCSFFSLRQNNKGEKFPQCTAALERIFKPPSRSNTINSELPFPTDQSPLPPTAPQYTSNIRVNVSQGTHTTGIPYRKNSPVTGWGGLSKQSNVKMSNERPIHQPTHKTIHPPIGGGVYTDFKYSTQLKYLDSFKCYNILTDLGGYPLGGEWGRWMGLWVGVGVGVWGAPCKHTYACMHAHKHMYFKHDKHECLHRGGHLQLL